MIVVRISGGLGNQLFQYALGYSLSKEYKTDLVLDVSYYDLDHSRTYKLDKLKLENENYISYMQNLREKGVLRYIQIVINIIKKRHYLANYLIVEDGRGLYCIESDKKYYLRGFWQNEKYFSKFREDIIRQFVPTDAPSQIFCSWLERISKAESISVHIRRTDYIKYRAAIQKEFYLNAIKKMMELTNVDEREFFFFSDDIEWTDDLLASLPFKIKYSFVSKKSDLTDLEEMMLMKVCKHHIVANSSFSWFGAWLGNDNSIVIAPKLKLWNENFYPSNWILIAARVDEYSDENSNHFAFRTWLINKIKDYGYM